MRRLHGRIRMKFVVLSVAVLLLAALTLSACGGAKSELAAAAGGNGPGFKLPDLPQPGPLRHVSVLSVTTINGIDTFLRSSANVMDNGTGVKINVSGGVQWAMYKFNTGGNELKHLKVDLFEEQGNFHTWVAVTDYSSMHWRWFGPYHQLPAEIDLTGTAWANAAHDIYFVALTE